MAQLEVEFDPSAQRSTHNQHQHQHRSHSPSPLRQSRHLRTMSHGGRSPSQTSIPISFDTPAPSSTTPGGASSSSAQSSPSSPSPSPSPSTTSLAADVKSSLSRTLSWPFRDRQAGPLLYAGMRELRDIFDLDSVYAAERSVVQESGKAHWHLRVLEAGDGERQRGSDERRGERRGKGNAGGEAALRTRAQGADFAGARLSKPSEGTDLHVTASRSSLGLCLALLATACAWGIATLLALRQDHDVFSPLLAVPMALPLPLSAFALVLLARPLTEMAATRLILISRVLRAHILLQGLVAAAVWFLLSQTATYHTQQTPMARLARPLSPHHADVGSLTARTTYLFASVAQAVLPLALALRGQWLLASALAHRARPVQQDLKASSSPCASERKVDAEGIMAASAGRKRRASATASPRVRTSLLPMSSDEVDEVSQTGYDERHRPSPPTSPDSLRTKFPFLASEAEPHADHGERQRRARRSSHRSRRPSTVASHASAPAPAFALSPPVLAPLRSPPRHGHRRSQSQPFPA